MSRCPDVIPKMDVTAEQELKVMRFWREGERSISNLMKRARVKSPQVWAILHHYAVHGAAKP
jgi:hypothetical protein